jgi:pullulanase/glycogen debranching enzyme
MSTKAIHYGGKSFPLGATLSPGGANFSIFAKHSRAAQLLLFDRVDDSKPSRVIDLRSAYQPHIPLLAHLRAGRHRGPALWLPRSGPFRSRKGLRFDPERCCSILTGNASHGRWGGAERQLGDRETMWLPR